MLCGNTAQSEFGRLRTAIEMHGNSCKCVLRRYGGVDAIAFDPDRIRGGKIIIQAKRYTNTVGLSAVRDLYETKHNEGAIKGILVTTADYAAQMHTRSLQINH